MPSPALPRERVGVRALLRSRTTQGSRDAAFLKRKHGPNDPCQSISLTRSSKLFGKYFPRIHLRVLLARERLKLVINRVAERQPLVHVVTPDLARRLLQLESLRRALPARLGVQVVQLLLRVRLEPLHPPDEFLPAFAAHEHVRANRLFPVVLERRHLLDVFHEPGLPVVDRVKRLADR